MERQRRAHPERELPAKRRLILLGVTRAPDQPKLDLAEALLNHVRLLDVQSVLEDVIESHDPRTFRRHDVIIFAALDPRQHAGAAAAWTGRSLASPHGGVPD